MRYDMNGVPSRVQVLIVCSFLAAPIIAGVCDVPVIWLPLLILGPILVVLIFYFVRKKIIMANFVKCGDIGDKVEITEVRADDFESSVNGRVFMFAYSEYMKVVLYNWLRSLDVIGDEKLNMYKVFIDNHAPEYLAVCESELSIPEISKEQYDNETSYAIQLADMVHGKVVNQKLYERITKSRP